MDPQTALNTPDTSPPPRSLFESLAYGASLPERFVRSACGLTAGTAKELAQFLVPRSFQDSKTYEVVVRNSLDFLISQVGGVTPAPSAQAVAPAEDYLARKAVGNFMDFAGLAMLHLSPLWVLAVVSDVAYGTKTYMHELARELQSQGLIDDASTIHHIDDVLEAVQRASGSAANTFDQPPLSIEALRASVDQTRQALRAANPRQLFPEAELANYWKGMRDLAEQERVSLLGVSGAIAMQTLSAMKSVSQGTLTSVIVAGQLVNRTVFTHYRDSLRRVRDEGLWNSVRNSYGPYLDGIWNNFRSDRRTWTEALVDWRTYSRGWLTIRRWLRRRRAPRLPVTAPDAPPAQADSPPTSQG